MASFSSAQAVYGLTATASPAGTNISGKNTVGIGASVLTLDSADTAYSFKATAATTNNVFIFYPATGVATILAGTPTVSDADGNDCEGVAISAMTQLYGLMFRAGTANGGSVLFSAADPLVGATFGLKPGEMRLIASTSYIGADVTKAWTVTLPTANSTIEVVAIGV